MWKGAKYVACTTSEPGSVPTTQPDLLAEWEADLLKRHNPSEPAFSHRFSATARPVHAAFKTRGSWSQEGCPLGASDVPSRSSWCPLLSADASCIANNSCRFGAMWVTIGWSECLAGDALSSIRSNLHAFASEVGSKTPMVDTRLVSGQVMEWSVHGALMMFRSLQ